MRLEINKIIDMVLKNLKLGILGMHDIFCIIFFILVASICCLQCFDTVGLASGRASSP